MITITAHVTTPDSYVVALDGKIVAVCSQERIAFWVSRLTD